MKVARTCKHCGSEFFYNWFPCREKRTEGQFCSLSCSAKYANRKHGHSPVSGRTRTYSSWASMLTRTKAPENRPEFERYVKRGITVCDRWRVSFENFLADMGECPEGLSIDRVDNNKGYYKENCR